VRELTAYVTDYAERAVVSGVSPSAILVDPAHDFGKNTWQSLEITRRLDELTSTGWPVLVAVADKDFIGETLSSGALPVDQRAEGTIATLAVCAWLGARVFRVHNVPAARAALSAVADLRRSARTRRT
jgi:dihydropteroate synthase